MFRKSFKLFAGCSLLLFCVSIVYLHSNNTFVSVYYDNNETSFNVDELSHRNESIFNWQEKVTRNRF